MLVKLKGPSWKVAKRNKDVSDCCTLRPRGEGWKILDVFLQFCVLWDF